MAVTQELAGGGGVGDFFLQRYFQHKNIHEVNLQLNRINFKSLSTLPLIKGTHRGGNEVMRCCVNIQMFV